ncbi:fasciclin domain-containing protein [Nonomuraea phyllanthi]|uniref:Fasciclin domain-containing protein n=1 Tax=Nonomuraea phyllanthi TaxID=2219224 RepID=A0A5C4WCJ0_9ACTN|nr:fasciclin domain-containing protein [Nonomuraea phyllanthi]
MGGITVKRVLLAAALALTASTAGTAADAAVWTPAPESSPSPEDTSTMPEESPSPDDTMPEASPPEASPGATAAPIGPGCATLQSSLAGIKDQPVGTALSQVPELSMLSDAVKKAGLEEKLNSAEDITVFAPNNKAFEAIPKETRDKVMSDKKLLEKAISYHVVEGKKTPDQLQGATLTTMEGSDLTVKGSGENLTINGAKIVCGGVPTKNATLYVVDKVLMPQ